MLALIKCITINYHNITKSFAIAIPDSFMSVKKKKNMLRNLWHMELLQ